MSAAALSALGFLVIMLLAGRSRPMQNLVAFEAAGLMRETPDQIDRVELGAEGSRLVLTREPPGQWTLARPSPAPLAPPAASHVETSLRFMHVAAPVRVMTRAEYQPESLADYGLDPPRYTVSLQHGGRTVLVASFGRRNPQDIFQYVRVEGRDELYLIPVFVGREWEAVASSLAAS